MMRLLDADVINLILLMIIIMMLSNIKNKKD